MTNNFFLESKFLNQTFYSSEFKIVWIKSVLIFQLIGLDCDQYLNCISCPDSSKTPEDRGGYNGCPCPSISNCLRCSSTTHCDVCKHDYLKVFDPATPTIATCASSCPNEYEISDSTNSHCMKCAVKDCKKKKVKFNQNRPENF